jgi:hypothetical protein
LALSVGPSPVKMTDRYLTVMGVCPQEAVSRTATHRPIILFRHMQLRWRVPKSSARKEILGICPVPSSGVERSRILGEKLLQLRIELWVF